MLYRIIEPLKEGEKVQYLGAYVLQWNRGNRPEPTVGFVEATEEEIRAELNEGKK